MQKTEPIGTEFIRAGLVTRQQLDQALEKQNLLKRQESLGDVLVSMGFISDKDRIRCQGEQWGVAYVDLADQEFDNSVTRLVAQNVARKLKVLAIGRHNGRITLAMKNPLDIFAIDEVRMLTGLD